MSVEKTRAFAAIFAVPQLLTFNYDLADGINQPLHIA